MAQHSEKLTISGELSIEQLELCRNGFTYQNQSYILLLNLFEQENIRKVSTSHIEFGQSIDMSNDMALCLKNKNTPPLQIYPIGYIIFLEVKKWMRKNIPIVLMKKKRQ